MATKEECLQIMQAITNKAREMGCLLEIPGDGAVFTPDEVDALNQEGRFIWANWENWRLLRPAAYLERHTLRIDKAYSDHKDAYTKVTRFAVEQERWKATKGD